MNKLTLVKYLKSQINECEKILEHTTDRALKAYYQGQIYAFELVLREVEDEKNPDCQEPNIFDEMLIHGGKLEGEKIDE